MRRELAAKNLNGRQPNSSTTKGTKGQRRSKPVAVSGDAKVDLTIGKEESGGVLGSLPPKGLVLSPLGNPSQRGTGSGANLCDPVAQMS